MKIIPETMNKIKTKEQSIYGQLKCPKRSLKYVISSITCLLIIMISLPHLATAIEADLYHDSDDVLRLNETNFASNVFQPNNSVAYMVEFYNTYCGHCQAFAPVYKEFATKVKNWTSVARVAGVDCAKDINVNLCADNNIIGYPTIYIFPPQAQKEDPAKDRIDYRLTKHDWSIDGLKEAIIENLFNLTSSQRKYRKALDGLHPIEVKNLNDIKSVYQSDADSSLHDDVVNEPQQRDFMIIVESSDLYLGRELIVEYARISERLELRRVLLNNTDLLKNLLPSEDLVKIDEIQPLLLKLDGDLGNKPKVQILVRGEFKQTLPTSETYERMDALANRFKSFFEHYYGVELRHLQSVIGSDGSILKRPELPMNSNDDSWPTNDNSGLELQQKGHLDKKRIFASDLLKSITYIFTHEILLKGDLGSKDFNTIRNLLTILNKFLPLEKWDRDVYKFIVELRTRLDYKRTQYDKYNLKRQQLRDLVSLAGGDDLRRKYSETGWQSCAESQKKDKGYTCSLWLLFHILTVGEYHRASPARAQPILVLSTMRDYIINFFGCSVCSVNFKKETDDLESALTNRNSSLLWLWQTHNHVNARLNRERGSSRTIPEVIFPSYLACPTCYESNPTENYVHLDSLEDINWNRSGIFKFLDEIYKPSSLITSDEVGILYSQFVKRGEIKSQIQGRYIDHLDGVQKLPLDVNSSVDSRSGTFSTGDMGLWLILYLASIIIVVVVCISLNPRWKRFKTM